MICRFSTGIGGAFCFLSCVRLASRWFPPQRMALVIGLVVTMAMIGGTLAQTPFTWLADNFGWRTTLRIDALVGVFFLMAIIALVRDYPPGYEKSIDDQHHKIHDMGVWKTTKAVFANPQKLARRVFTQASSTYLFWLLGAMWGGLYLKPNSPPFKNTFLLCHHDDFHRHDCRFALDRLAF